MYGVRFSDYCGQVGLVLALYEDPETLSGDLLKAAARSSCGWRPYNSIVFDKLGEALHVGGAYLDDAGSLRTEMTEPKLLSSFILLDDDFIYGSNLTIIEGEIEMSSETEIQDWGCAAELKKLFDQIQQ